MRDLLDRETHDVWAVEAAILTVGFKLDEYARFVTKADLPEGFAVVITDHVGGI